MAENLRQLKEFDFGKHADALVKYIKKYWNISAVPKGYKEFCKNYTDFDGQNEAANMEAEMLKEFEGHDGDGSMAFSFPMTISLAHTAYDDICQGRNPLRVLIAAIFSYGMQYGMRYEQVYKNSNMNHRIDFIGHCINALQYETDKEKRKLKEEELKDLRDTNINLSDTLDKFSLAEHHLSKKRALLLIKTVGRFTREKVVVYQTTFIGKPWLGRLWGHMRSLCGVYGGKGGKDNPVYTELKKELRAFGVSVKKNRDNMVYTFTPIKRKRKEGCWHPRPDC